MTQSKMKHGDYAPKAKRMALDGTEITVYNQSLYEPSVASSAPRKGGYKKVQRLGKSRQQMKLQFASSSQKSNMLVPVSDVASMQGVENE